MNWKTKTMLVYILGGLMLGVLAGIMTVSNAEETQKEPELDLKKGAKFGIDAINLIRKNIAK